MILGECLLISSLPCKALRTLVDIMRLAEQFNMPGKLDIKRCEPGILFISLPIVSLFKLAIMTYFFYFCVNSVSLATSFVIMT